MIERDELRHFQQMWTWLSGYPAHDREYYMKHVEKLEEMWLNSCPLCNSAKESHCSGCQMLWKSTSGNLCTDPDSPLFKWKNTDRQWADERISFASRTALLAMKLSYQLDGQTESGKMSRAM